MNRKTFLTSILAGIGLAVKGKEIIAGGGGNDKLIGSGDVELTGQITGFDPNFVIPFDSCPPNGTTVVCMSNGKEYTYYQGEWLSTYYRGGVIEGNIYDKSVTIPGMGLTDEQKQTLLSGNWIN